MTRPVPRVWNVPNTLTMSRLVLAAVVFALIAYEQFFAALVVFGIARLLRQRHPRWRGLRVGIVGLTYWSFLVAFAHGAGLMVLPFVLHAASPADSSHVHHLTAGSDVVTSLLAAAPECRRLDLETKRLLQF